MVVFYIYSAKMSACFGIGIREDVKYRYWWYR